MYNDMGNRSDLIEHNCAVLHYLRYVGRHVHLLLTQSWRPPLLLVCLILQCSDSHTPSSFALTYYISIAVQTVKIGASIYRPTLLSGLF